MIRKEMYASMVAEAYRSVSLEEQAAWVANFRLEMRLRLSKSKKEIERNHHHVSMADMMARKAKLCADGVEDYLADQKKQAGRGCDA